jgi:hypothetical protein
VKKGTAFEFGAPQMLFESGYLMPGSFSYDVASDGRFIIIASASFFGRTPINVVLNWTQLLTTRAPRD